MMRFILHISLLAAHGSRVSFLGSGRRRRGRRIFNKNRLSGVMRRALRLDGRHRPAASIVRVRGGGWLGSASSSSGVSACRSVLDKFVRFSFRTLLNLIRSSCLLQLPTFGCCRVFSSHSIPPPPPPAEAGPSSPGHTILLRRRVVVLAIDLVGQIIMMMVVGGPTTTTMKVELGEFVGGSKGREATPPQRGA